MGKSSWELDSLQFDIKKTTDRQFLECEHHRFMISADKRLFISIETEIQVQT